MIEKIEIDVSIACDLLLASYRLMPTSQKLVWLQKYGDILCDLKLFPCIEALHSIDEKSKYEPMIIDFWGSIDKVKYKDIVVSDIIDLIEDTCYDSHIEFEFNHNTTIDDIKFSMQSFGRNKFYTYYSAPFFRSVIKNNSLGLNDIIYVTKAKTPNGMHVIVFKIKVGNGSNTYAHYDISTDPGFTNSII